MVDVSSVTLVESRGERWADSLRFGIRTSAVDFLLLLKICLLVHRQVIYVFIQMCFRVYFNCKLYTQSMAN